MSFAEECPTSKGAMGDDYSYSRIELLSTRNHDSLFFETVSKLITIVRDYMWSSCSFCLDTKRTKSHSIQGCEKICGGHGISATFYQWSIAHTASKTVPSRYD